MTGVHPTSDGEEPVLVTIQKIKDKLLDPRNLTKEERQLCVETLLFEGYTEAQIAQVLSRCQKTVKRDLQEIRARNALTPSVDLAKKLIGELLLKTEVHHNFLMRLARKSDGSINERSQAEYMAWRVLRESNELLQSLGYLPVRPKEITGDLFHHFNDESSGKSFEEARKSLDEIIKTAGQCGKLTPELEKHVESLQRKIEKAEIIDESDRLLKEQNNKNTEEK